MAGDYDEYANRQSAEELVKIEKARRANYNGLWLDPWYGWHPPMCHPRWHPPKAWPPSWMRQPKPMDAPVELPHEIAAHLNDKRPEGRQQMSRGAWSRRQVIAEYGREQMEEIIEGNKKRAAELFAQAAALKPGYKKNRLLEQVEVLRSQRRTGQNRNTGEDCIKTLAAEKARDFAKERYGYTFSPEYIIRYLMDGKRFK